MFRLLWSASVATRYFLRRYMPTNIALDAIRTRRGLRWGTPAMLLAIPYLYAASICVAVVEDDGPGWLNLLVILLVWNALKFVIMGPVSLAILVSTRLSERRQWQIDTICTDTNQIAPTFTARRPHRV
ncbi:sulfate permease [Nesterenkonia haasae]|uniref:sulfate permease n=1 Tax=Nesterenkonia haasae TaxID=2587813 RepID=UPI001F2EA40D|nr:sulfate permease [Nesterenkonia haasae]